MIQIKLFDKSGNVKIHLSKDKKYVITKENFQPWKRIEIKEVGTNERRDRFREVEKQSN